MLENLNAPELRRELASDRAESLRRSARPSAPGPLRRSLGTALVRAGVRVGAPATATHAVWPKPDPSSSSTNGLRGVGLKPDPAA